jgi:hypothetical protein
MAIVFVSARNKQNAFVWGIGVLLILFVIVLSVVVFLPELLNAPPEIPPGVGYASP